MGYITNEIELSASKTAFMSSNPWLVSGHKVAGPVHRRAAVELEVRKRWVGVGDRFGYQRAKPPTAPSSQPRQILGIRGDTKGNGGAIL